MLFAQIDRDSLTWSTVQLFAPRSIEFVLSHHKNFSFNQRIFHPLFVSCGVISSLRPDRRCSAAIAALITQQYVSCKSFKDVLEQFQLLHTLRFRNQHETFVDDAIIAAKFAESIDELMEHIKSNFGVTAGEESFYTGMEMADCSPAPTPARSAFDNLLVARSRRTLRDAIHAAKKRSERRNAENGTTLRSTESRTQYEVFELALPTTWDSF